MLLWVNGPFGGGKTQTAHELRRRLPGSVLCDPEEVGFGLHRMMPPGPHGDFQDLPAWRQGVRRLHRRRGPLRVGPHVGLSRGGALRRERFAVARRRWSSGSPRRPG